MKSPLFQLNQYQQLEIKIRDFLNSQSDSLSGSTVESTRAVGDAIENILAENFHSILGDAICKTYSSEFSRRAMADLAFEDRDDFYYVVDVKTHRLSTKFNMPNLTSVERLARFYSADKNYFVVLMVKYDISGLRAVIQEVSFVPIEFLAWSCLTIGALGWGQIQIANSNLITINPQYSRKKWMLELCDELLEFYPREIAKIDARIRKFQSIRAEWEQRSD